MKHLRDYIVEELTTPTNTVGMGDPVLPTETTVGSGDQFLIKKARSNKEHSWSVPCSNKRASKNKKLRKVYK